MPLLLWPWSCKQALCNTCKTVTRQPHFVHRYYVFSLIAMHWKTNNRNNGDLSNFICAADSAGFINGPPAKCLSRQNYRFSIGLYSLRRLKEHLHSGVWRGSVVLICSYTTTCWPSMQTNKHFQSFLQICTHKDSFHNVIDIKSRPFLNTKEKLFHFSKTIVILMGP